MALHLVMWCVYSKSIKNVGQGWTEKITNCCMSQGNPKTKIGSYFGPIPLYFCQYDHWNFFGAYSYRAQQNLTIKNWKNTFPKKSLTYTNQAVSRTQAHTDQAIAAAAYPQQPGSTDSCVTDSCVNVICVTIICVTVLCITVHCHYNFIDRSANT